MARSEDRRRSPCSPRARRARPGSKRRRRPGAPCRHAVFVRRLCVFSDVDHVARAGTELSNAGRTVARATRAAASALLPLFDLAAGRFDSGVEMWREMLREDPASPLGSEDTHDQYAFELMLGGDLAAALVVFRAIAAVFPDSTRAYDHLGGALAAAGDAGAAITAYQAALTRLETDAQLPPAQRADVRAHIEHELSKLYTSYQALLAAHGFRPAPSPRQASP